MKKPFLILSSLSLLLSGTAKPEPLSNDDPSKYTITKDVLWASPGGFDLASLRLGRAARRAGSVSGRSNSSSNTTGGQGSGPPSPSPERAHEGPVTL